MKSLTKSQMMVLRMIRDNPHIRPMELSDELDLSHRTITKALRELKHKKLVKKVRDPLLMDLRKAFYVAT